MTMPVWIFGAPSASFDGPTPSRGRDVHDDTQANATLDVETASLIERLRQNDPSVIEYVFDQWYVALVAFGARITGRSDRAEELVQDVLVQVWEQRTTIVVHSTLRGYLFRAVRNRALNDKQRSVRESMAEHRMLTDAREGGATDGNTPDRALLDRERDQLVRDAVDALPQRYRRVAELRGDGLTYREIADVLGLPAKTVESQGRHAIQLLRVALERVGF